MAPDLSSASQSGSPADRGSQSPEGAQSSAPLKYIATRSPRRGSRAGAVRTFWYLLKHAISPGVAPAPEHCITKTQPSGIVVQEQLPLCEKLANAAAERLSTLEQKSTALLSVVLVLAPLLIAGAVYLRREPMPRWATLTSAFLLVLAGAMLTLALVAALRAIAIRPHSVLFLGTIIDPERDTVRMYDPDYYGRGLLFEAAERQGVADQVADFVRASQQLLVLTIILSALATVPLQISFKSRPQQVEGTIALDDSTLKVIRGLVEGNIQQAATRTDGQLRAIRSRLDAVATQMRGQGPAK